MLTPTRRWFLGAGALISAGLTGCGASERSPRRRTLTALVPDDGGTRVIEAAAERYGRSSGTPVRLRRVPPDAYEAELGAALDGDAGGPDLVFHWGSGSIRTAAEEYRVTDLHDLMLDRPELGRSFLPAALTGGHVNERPYGVPVRGTRPVLLFYDRTLFADLGLRPPADWTTLRRAVARLTKAGVTPFALAGADPSAELMWLAYLVERLGGPEVFGRIQAGDYTQWDHPAVLRAAREVTSLAEDGAFGDDFADVSATGGSATARFARGRAAMHLMDSREHAALVDRFPAFARGQLGWLPFPAVEGGKGDPKNLIGTPAGYLSAGDLTGGRGEVLDFLEEFSTPEHTDALLAAGEVPVTVAAARRLGASPHPEFTRFQYELVRDAPVFTLNWEQAVHPVWRAALRGEVADLFSGRSTPRGFVRNLRERRVAAAQPG
ncbi:ABC transporter substrate-binding protein [Streptomyces sp. NPDC087226]|uniref:ABC transporter substrate-binding protein n=1 Tax=Streptomyces sp. NPDC087226 TaxID=3365771 RepID=UPI003816E418